MIRAGVMLSVAFMLLPARPGLTVEIGVTALLQGKTPKVAETKPFGCGIAARRD